MPIDYASVVYTPAQDIFGRPVVVTPVVSQPGMPAFTARGIYTTEPEDLLAEDGSVFSDQRTILDVITKEFDVLPIQGDLVSIPSTSGIPAEGQFVISDLKDNGGGETTFLLRRSVEAKPAG
jgi:hypothetical protein